MSEFTTSDVRRLVAYMVTLWPSYGRWEVFQDDRVHEAWANMLTRGRYEYADTVAGLQALVLRVRRDHQWPPSLAEICEASNAAKRDRWDKARQEEARHLQEREDVATIHRLRENIKALGQPTEPYDMERLAIMRENLELLENRYPDA